MTTEPTLTRVLLVDDNAGDAALLCKLLEKATLGRFAVHTVNRLSEAVRLAATGQFDVVVLDPMLPDSHGLETLEMMHRAAPLTPIVILTAQDNERIGLEALNKGAQDYFLKSDIDGRVMARALLYAIERRRSQEQLSRRDALLAEAQQIAGLGSFDWDLGNGAVTLSAELSRIYGVDKEPFDANYQSMAAKIHPDDRTRVEQSIDAALTSKQSFELEYRVLRSPDDVRVLHGRGHFVFDAEGQPIRMVGTGQDVTERKKLEQKLQFAGRMTCVGTLAAGVAHEITNPLSFVIANLEFIGQELRGTTCDALTGRARELNEMVDDARQGAERIRRIVRGLKTFSRADEERRVPLELQPLIELSINMTFNEIRHRARLVKDYGRTPHVEADEARLSQVFVNLLVNAAHAIGDGRAEDNEIRIVTSTDLTGRAVVEIRDTGCGISEANRSLVFDPFFTTKPIGVGTGLGLSICHGIVTAHGGEISLDSELGRGTTFKIVLPPARPDALPRSDRPVSRIPPGRRGRILVIDDEPMVAAAIHRILASDHEIFIAANGKQAVDRFKRGERFDVILSDLMMPVMNGMDLYDWLSQNIPEQADRIIYVTGGAFTPAAQAFLDRVPNQRVEKPFDAMNILGLVRNMVH